MKPKVDFERALIIKPEFLEQILKGKKTWEMRSRRTNIRGKIGLIKSGSGEICGTVDLIDCKGPLSLKEYKDNARKAGMKPADVSRSSLPICAWVLKSPKRLRKPIKYKHPAGAITWVKVKKAIKARQ